MRFTKSIIIFLLFLVVAASPCLAGESALKTGFNVKQFSLENGMLFLVVERPVTPQVACRIAIRAGSALEETGKTGIAHLLEHMMFKGTKNFGTLNFQKDEKLQKKIESAYQVVLREELKRKPDQGLIASKLEEMAGLRREVQKIYVPQAFSSQLGRNGAVRVNAFTSKDQTQYMVSVPSDMLEQWFSIASEQLFEPSWREFYVEKEVVQREWAFRYINNPGGAAWLDMYATSYNAHPYRNPTIGWKSDMEKYSTEDGMAFHKKYYNPANAVCVLVGDITLDEAKKLAKIYFERYPTGARAPEEVTQEPPQAGPRKSLRYLKGARTPLVRIGYHGARTGHEDFYALDVMTMILSQGRGARMTQNIVDAGMAVNAWVHNPDNRYGGMVMLGGTPNEPEVLKGGEIGGEEKKAAYLKACEDLEHILVNEIEKLKTHPVTPRELKRVIKLTQRQFLGTMRSNEQMAGTLATMEVQVGWRYLTNYLDRIAAVTPERIMDVARRYIEQEKRTTVYILPGGRPDSPPERYVEERTVTGFAAVGMERSKTFENHSIYPTPKGWKHPLSFEREPRKIHYPRAETFDVEGAKVFFLPDRELPLIDLTIMVKAGEVDLEKAKAGLDTVLNGSVIRGGTAKYSPRALALALDENAIKLSVGIGQEDAQVSLSILKGDWERGLAFLDEVLLGPRFDPEILTVVKREIVVGLKRQSEDARAVSSRESMIWHFKGHPYGRDPLQELQTIPAITREDLKEFLKTYFVPSNMVVAVSGDIEKAEVVLGLRRLFGKMQKKKAPERHLADPGVTAPVLTLIHKPGQIQSQVALALPSVKRTDPEYWKISLLMNIFGGSDSLLHVRLRDDLGLVYATWFYQTYKWQAGLLRGYIGCKADKTAEAIRETAAIMSGLGKDVPEAEIMQKRMDALNSFVFNVDSPEELVEVYSRYHMRKEPLDTLERIQDAYMAVGRMELKALANRFLDPKKLQVFIVADKTIKLVRKDGTTLTLEEDLKSLAGELGLPFREMALR
ncbi:MAG: insulinase family protein [Deltaproteobacteria bacterium]|nr:insulinase family protein [Deltaproteobacteria bacterium]MBW2205892.1 insulinase family protein [Deltaproteobacteria bacterium]